MLIVCNSVFLEQSQELLLKTNLPMMFLLAMERVDGKDRRICTGSSMPPTSSAFLFWRAMPPKNGQSLSRRGCVIRGRRCLVLKIVWKKSSRQTCQSFSRPFGTYRKVDFPGVETPGYSHDVPPGQSTRPSEP